MASKSSSASESPVSCYFAAQAGGGGEYVLGADELESTRLGLQHRLWSASAHELWERAGILPGMSVLDVGCGPGQATLELAEIVGPTGRVVGVDESPLFLKQLHQAAKARGMQQLERVLGDVQQLDQLMSGAGMFDVAYCRWVLCFVPDVESVVRGVARLLKPGARLVVQDYFNYESMSLAPRRAAFSRVIAAVGKSWRSRGGDPDIMASVPGLIRKHGLSVGHLAVNQRVARPGSTLWAWPDTFWASFVPRLESMGHISGAERRDFERTWAAASGDPDSFMHLPPVFDLIGIKDSSPGPGRA